MDRRNSSNGQVDSRQSWSDGLSKSYLETKCKQFENEFDREQSGEDHVEHIQHIGILF